LGCVGLGEDDDGETRIKSERVGETPLTSFSPIDVGLGGYELMSIPVVRKGGSLTGEKADACVRLYSRKAASRSPAWPEGQAREWAGRRGSRLWCGVPR
jgi:hypothetical protein